MIWESLRHRSPGAWYSCQQAVLQRIYRPDSNTQDSVVFVYKNKLKKTTMPRNLGGVCKQIG